MDEKTRKEKIEQFKKLAETKQERNRRINNGENPKDVFEDLGFKTKTVKLIKGKDEEEKQD